MDEKTVDQSNNPAPAVDAPLETANPVAPDEAKKKKRMVIILVIILLLLLGLLGYIGYQLYQDSQEDDDVTIVVDVEDDDEEEEEIDEDSDVDEDTVDETTDETDDEDTTVPTLYNYEFEFNGYDGGVVTVTHMVNFESSVADLVLTADEPDPTKINQVARLTLSSGDLQIQFQSLYEGFNRSYNTSVLTEVYTNSEIGVIQRHQSSDEYSLGTTYVSDIQMSGSCTIMGESVTCPAGPAALTYEDDEGASHWLWMSCSGDTDFVKCDEIVESLEISFTEILSVNPL